MFKQCKICKVIYKKNNRITWEQFRRQQFCSRDCKGIHHSHTITGTQHHNWKARPKCLDCSKQLKTLKSKRCFKCWHKFNTGKNNANYKEHPTNYKYIHQVIINKLGQPDTCKHCKKSGLTGRQIHWANKSGKYLRDSKDWIRLCLPCHRRFDSR